MAAPTPTKNIQQQKTTLSQKQTLEDVRDLLDKNERLLRRIRRYLIGAQVLSVLKIVIILAPLVAAVYYLPPLLEKFSSISSGGGILQPYQELLQGQPRE